MTLQVQVHFEKVNTVAPSLLQPSKQLGSRTPMQLVGMSNLKLNREMYSPRAQSIHRRILIKNFLTMLYQRHPIEWIEDSPVDDKDHWMEQTLSAVGIEEHSDAYQNDYDESGNHNYNNHSDNNHYRSRGPSSGPPVPDRLLSTPSKVTPLPRPASGELPQSLHNYLSNVFDVDWSPDSNNTEDSFYTAKSSSRPASTSSPALASQLSQLSFSSTTPPPASWTVAAERKTRTPRTRSFTSDTGHYINDSPGSLREPFQDGTPQTTFGRQPQQEEYMKSTQTQDDPMPRPRPRIRTQPQLPSTHDTIDYNNYHQAVPISDLKISKSNRTQPVYESTSARLEYQQYQERQKQFVTDDHGEDSKPGSGARGFIKMLSRQGSKKKLTTISAPLPKIASISGPLLLQDIPRHAPVQYPVDTTTGSHRLKVLIAGGNIQGLVLALILHRLNVDILVLERAHSQGVSPGSIVMGSFAVNLLEMLEILAPIANTQELRHLRIWDEHGASQAEVDFSGARERYGHNGLVVNTRELQTTLRDQLPGHCVLDGKSVVDYGQDADGVTVWCEDGSCYRGAILVGCDGRNSTVRRILYEQTQHPPEDEEAVSTADMDRNLAGMTNEIAHDELIDPTTNECIFRQDWGDSQVIIGRSAPFTCWITPMPNERKLSWMISCNHVPGTITDSPSEAVHYSLPSAAMDPAVLQREFVDQVRHFKFPLGGTIGDILDKSDWTEMRRVPNEKHIYHLWHEGRVVLAGEGQGSLQAILDACSLAPLIQRALFGGGELESIDAAFEAYRQERFLIAQDATNGSAGLGRLLSRNQLNSDNFAFEFDFDFDYFPAWLQRIAEIKGELIRLNIH
ncbi:hypothetical protein BG000_011596 [Podila horticola]|nr:hypothetical protein BG000_011596 [Podila horticola]